ILKDLEYLGIEVDYDLNEQARGVFADISAKSSKVKVLVIPTNEELVIARDTKAIVESLSK
ncbi:MAG: acetate kinase, partial [Clostridia bacterium]|nr:acetate kinase [Clostridia bacterium]